MTDIASNFSLSDPFCVLHAASNEKCTSEAIIIFKPETLRRCEDILSFRKQQQLKYYNKVTLPTALDDSSGYHISCYRRFVALSEAQRKRFNEISSNTNNEENFRAATTRNNTESGVQTKSASGVFRAVCLFCQQARKRVKGTEQKLVNVETKDFEENIRKYATWKNDEYMLRNISNIDFVSKEVKYHSFCRIQYQRESELAHGKEKQSIGDRSVYQKAFDLTAQFVEDRIIKGKDVYYLTDLTNYFNAALQEYSGEDCNSSSQKLEKRLKDHFNETIKVEKGKTRRGNIVYCSSMSFEEAIRRIYIPDEENQVREGP